MTTVLRNGTSIEDPRLDRLPSKITTHLERYPLTAATMPEEPKPLVGGFNWYDNCFTPRRTKIQGRHYATLPGPTDLGRLAGGHAIAFPAWGQVDTDGWWAYYDQGREGRCTEFAALRMLSLLNRKRYDLTSKWHYWEAQRNDEWAGGSYPGAFPQYEGSSVRAILDVVHKRGAVLPWKYGKPFPADMDPGLHVRPEEGIAAYRWITDWADARRVTGTPDWMPGLIYLQSWGYSHPHRTVMPDETGERLLSEFGELAVVTDR